MQDIINGRCGWCGTDELYVKYHDEEWGKTVTERQDTIRVSCIGKCPGGTELDNHPQKAGRLPQSLLQFRCRASGANDRRRRGTADAL